MIITNFYYLILVTTFLYLIGAIGLILNRRNILIIIIVVVVLAILYLNKNKISKKFKKVQQRLVLLEGMIMAGNINKDLIKITIK